MSKKQNQSFLITDPAIKAKLGDYCKSEYERIGGFLYNHWVTNHEDKRQLTPETFQLLLQAPPTIQSGGEKCDDDKHSFVGSDQHRDDSSCCTVNANNNNRSHRFADELLKQVRLVHRVRFFLRKRFRRGSYHFIEDCVVATHASVLMNMVAGKVECAKRFLASRQISQEELAKLAGYIYQVAWRTAAQLYRKIKSDRLKSNNEAIDLLTDKRYSNGEKRTDPSLDIEVRQICIASLEHAHVRLEPRDFEALMLRLKGNTLGEIGRRFECDRNRAAEILHRTCLVIGEYLVQVIPPRFHDKILERFETSTGNTVEADHLLSLDDLPKFCTMIADRAVRHFSKTQRQLRFQKVRRRAPPI